MSDPVITIAVAAFGALIGSFLNVVIYRVPRKESISFPPSHCPECDMNIKPYDNIPVISWLLLRGKCRACGAPISARYPAVEALTAALFGLAAWQFGFTLVLPAALVFLAILVAVSFIDLEHQIIPNKIILPGMPIALGLVLLQGAGPALTGVAGFLIGGGLLLLVAMINPAGMGAGDVKMAAFMGVFLGYYVLIALLVAFILGAVIGLILIATGIRTRKEPVPFGPFLALGSLAALFAGAQIWAAYSSFAFGAVA